MTAKLKNLRRRVERARNAPHNTCPASRYLHEIAEALAARRPYPMLVDCPELSAEIMLSVLESLWKARTELAKLRGKP